jgi:hypothetical protein
MRLLAAALACALIGGGASAKDTEGCIMAAGAVTPDFAMPHVAAAIAKKRLDVAVIGSASSELTGPSGSNLAYPTRLAVALGNLLPGVAVKVTTYAQARETAGEMEHKLSRIVAQSKPALVVWQTGTADANMDVLPLYIVLLAGFPPMLWILLRSPAAGLGASLLLYLLTWNFGWNLPAYPNGYWVFNPFAWQLLFVFGAWCGLGGAKRLATLIESPITFVVAVLYLVFACAIALTWYIPGLDHFVPKWLEDWMYPIDKTNLDVLRFAHFMALAVVTVRLVPQQWKFLNSPWLRPAILCGQHSLEIFCLGVFLSFAGHFAMVEINEGIAMQIAVSVSGIVAMVATAALISWYKKVEGRSPGLRPGPPGATTL